MTLQKTPVNINFSQGLDTKSDPFQVPLGKFLNLSNSVFTKEGLLQKRNGFLSLSSLPDDTSNYVTTFNGNLTAISDELRAYSSASNIWTDKGFIQSLDLTVLPLLRNTINQVQCDSQTSLNGLVCTVYTNSPTSYEYVIADVDTGQNIVAPTLLVPTSGTVTGTPRVFLLRNHFVIVFSVTITATEHLQYIAISTLDPTVVTSASDITSSYTSHSTMSWDGVVANNALYLAWNSSASSLKATYIDATLLQHNTVTFAGIISTEMSLSADNSTPLPNIYITSFNVSSGNCNEIVVDHQLTTILAPTLVTSSTAIRNIATSANNGLVTIIFEYAATYGYDSSIATNFLQKATCTLSGTVVGPSVLVRSVGLASKAFLLNGSIYFLSVYNSVNQATYFLMDSLGRVVSKLAYGNAGGYLTLGLPSVSLVNNVAQIAYLVKDLATPANKDQGAPNNGNSVYFQVGINLATFTIGISDIVSTEIGKNLMLTGGIVWAYDGFSVVEQGFNLYPDYVEATQAPTGGHMIADTYFYSAVYEWADNQGNIFRSAPSIPIEVIVHAGTSTNEVTVNIPTLRVTYKSNVKITLYRWSSQQPIYYETTSTISPLLNDTTGDYVTYVDVNANTSIVGNPILYTTGGVVEDIGPPAASTMTLYKSRLFLVDAEDRNLLWYSKQVIENTPVEMSDLFTIFVAPTSGAQGSTGPITALAALDDKLVIFKHDAIYYLTGTGPDNTGANNDFSDPIFITSTVGCSNQHSIVFVPQGLMFQSDKGIWLLGRDLSTQYIGAPVELYNDFLILSALNIPSTNQVRFTLDNGIVLMYDYYFNQWGTFTGIPSISSTIYQGVHTFINSFGQVLEENPGSYLDGSNAVLMNFTTSWINLAGLQGYQRSYFFMLLGTYISPHKLALHISYDYAPGVTQQTIILPYNQNPAYGGDPTWGQESLWGGTGTLEQWKIHLQRQTCQSLQITMNEVFDPIYDTEPGAGLTLSGINMVVGLKKGWRPIGQRQSAG